MQLLLEWKYRVNMVSTHTAPHYEVPILGVLAVSLGSQTVAFPLEDVTEVLPAMAVTPLPAAPRVVVGVINLRGNPLPILDLRRRLGLPRREADPEHHVVVCRVGERQVGIWVDKAAGVRRLGEDEIVAIDETVEAPHVTGTLMLENEVLLVYDVQSFLGADEALRLEDAIAEGIGGSRR